MRRVVTSAEAGIQQGFDSILDPRVGEDDKTGDEETIGRRPFEGASL
jgi:hypothetical protein